MSQTIGAHGRGGADVLVLERDRLMREHVADVLAAAGRRVRRFADIVGATRSIGEQTPDVIVSNVDLGDPVAGPRLAIQLRADPSTARVGLVALTETIAPEWSLIRHFDAYVPKPVDLQLLVDLTEVLPDGARSRPLARSSPSAWRILRAATILVIRVDPGVLVRDRVLLACTGAHAIGASSAREAEEIVSTIHVDLAIAERALGRTVALDARLRLRGVAVIRLAGEGEPLDPWVLAAALHAGRERARRVRH